MQCFSVEADAESVDGRQREYWQKEGKRSRWSGWASNPVVGAMRRWVGSTPTSFRQPSVLPEDARLGIDQ